MSVLSFGKVGLQAPASREFYCYKTMIISTQQYKQIILDLFRSKKEAVTLDLITRIDTHLTLETCHFYRRGKLLFTLDQVVDALLAGELDNETIPPVRVEYITIPRKLIEGEL